MYEAVFDESFYRTNSGLGPTGTLAHYIAEGDRAGIDPSPYFSTRYYQSRYPDWQAHGARTTVEDFLMRLGADDVRQPHPLIDPVYYRARYPDLHELGSRAVLHFFRLGDKEVRSPSASFDADFYQRCYLALEAEYPFRDFVIAGRAAGHLPCVVPRSREQSREEAARITAGMTRPVLLCARDAQPAGVPILTMDIARGLAARGEQPLFALQWGGPLIGQFRAIGPVVLLGEGWTPAGLADGLPPRTPVVITTAAAAGMAPVLAAAGHRCLVLVNETAGSIQDQQLLAHLVAARRAKVDIVVSMPPIADGLKEHLGAVDVLRPGLVLPRTPLGAFRRVRHRLNGGTRVVFIGAGHADRRKGFDLFIEAAERIAIDRPDARFVWLGSLDSWARPLADAALRRGLDLTLPGFVPESLAWYRAADVYLLTSRQDPGPGTAVHAAAVGTPTVGYAAEIGLMGIAEDFGSFVPPGDVEVFAKTALAAAAAITPASRRALRRMVRQASAFGPYVDALSTRLMGRPAAGGA